MSNNTFPDTGYALLEHVNGVVLPADLAILVFALLCKGQRVCYDWQSKNYKREREYQPSLKVFTANDLAGLELNQD
jgi:hypothetical protein